MKLLQDNSALKTDEFSNASPYIIMFGPDKCGSTNKVSTYASDKIGHYLIKHRFTSFSVTRTQRLASTRRSTSRTLQLLALARPPLSTL